MHPVEILPPGGSGLAGLLLLVALGACAKPQEPAPPWKSIDAQTLRTMMASGKDITVVDTMSELECLDHRIPGTQCLACEEIENSASVLPADKERALVFYCESEGCYRSCRAAEAAIRYGYKEVYLLAGGIPAWKQAGYPMESVDRIPRMPIISVKAQDLKKMLAERKDLLLVDIRSEKSFGEGHIEGAVNIPLVPVSAALCTKSRWTARWCLSTTGASGPSWRGATWREGLEGDAPLCRHAGLAGNACPKKLGKRNGKQASDGITADEHSCYPPEQPFYGRAAIPCRFRPDLPSGRRPCRQSAGLPVLSR